MTGTEIKHWWLSVPLVSVAAGLAIWWGVVVLVGDADPMQHKEYFLIGYPLLLVVSGVLGWRYDTKAWHSGIWMFGAQFLIGLFTIKSDMNLWPIGLVVFAVLMVPCCGTALLGAYLQKRIRIKSN